MAFNSHPEPHHLSETEAELMDCLLAAPTVEYPWDPADPDTADYFTESDRNFSWDDWSDDEIGQESESFLKSIRSCWEPEPSPLETIVAQFGARVPTQWLAQIAANVGTLANANLEPVEQLVQSVRELLSNWATEDLLVMARPYAYAMRCNPGVDNPDNIVRPLAWTELSELERAKLTILIAQCAIDSIS